jgi:putative salt-induced outer membrane protein YdiY
MRTILCLTIFIATISLTTQANADEILLEDGSRLIGKILKLQDGTLTLQTKHTGKLTIDMSAVTGINADQELGIVQQDAAPQFGTLQLNDGEQQLSVEDAQPQLLDIAELTLLWDKDKKMPKPTQRWTGRFEFGLNGTDGNSERFSFTGRSEAKRKTDAGELSLYFQAYYAEANGEQSQNEITTGGRYDWEIAPKWNAYTRVEFEKDEFEIVDLRSILAFGVSHKFLERERQSLNARLGLGYLREDFESADTEQEVIMDLGYDYTLNLRDWIKVTHDLTYYAGIVSPIEEFRIVANTAAEFDLTDNQQWKLRAGVKHEYDDQPLPTVENLDTTYYLNLAYDW